MCVGGEGVGEGTSGGGLERNNETLTVMMLSYCRELKFMTDGDEKHRSFTVRDLSATLDASASPASRPPSTIPQLA